MRIDFSTGKLDDVADHLRGGRRREFVLLLFVLVIALIPYVATFWYFPWYALGLLLTAAFFKVISTLLVSSRTGTSHYIRYLLAGRNPIGMTGASSLLLGGVDAVLDWKEDLAERRRGGLKSLIVTVAKLLATPLGAVLMTTEFAWDILFLRRGRRLLGFKCQEFFSLANYHDLICPEKSNDIFYADLACARYKDDPHLYQWNRMRAMVFELQHYRLDIDQGLGVRETNLFRQDEITAYQTLKRLRIEEIENALASYYGESIDRFPLPPKLSYLLVKNARPLAHYLRLRGELGGSNHVVDCDYCADLQALLHHGAPDVEAAYLAWPILRLLEADRSEFGTDVSMHITTRTMDALLERGIVESTNVGVCRFAPSFLRDVECFLAQHFRAATRLEVEEAMLHKLPIMMTYKGRAYVPNNARDQSKGERGLGRQKGWGCLKLGRGRRGKKRGRRTRNGGRRTRNAGEEGHAMQIGGKREGKKEKGKEGKGHAMQ